MISKFQNEYHPDRTLSTKDSFARLYGAARATLL